jgi:hypothetical protein
LCAKVFFPIAWKSGSLAKDLMFSYATVKRNNSSKIFPTHYQNHNKELHGCSSFMNIEVEIINCIDVSVDYLPDGGGHATKWKALHKMDSFVKRKDHKNHWPNSHVFGRSF